MSNAPRTPNKSRFDYKPSPTLKPLKKFKTDWALSSFFYKSARDPKIEADIKSAEKTFSSFKTKWKDIEFGDDVAKLKVALTEYEKLAGNPDISRPGRYFSFRKCLNVNDVEADRALALLANRLRKASDQILFFRLNLGKLSPDKQKQLLNDDKLKHFKYFLTSLFEGAKHDLTEPEEKIIRLKSHQSSSMWHEAVEKIISNRTVLWQGKSVHIPEAIETLDLLKTKDKIKLWDLILVELEKIGEIAEHEMNAIVTDARQEDELRGYEKPYSATVLSYEDDEKSLENLVSAVSTRGFELSKKFYKLKAKYHKLPALHYTQKYESIGPDLSISFAESMEVCRDVFYGLKNEYGTIFDDMLKTGAIDVFPREGKRGGAFMSDETGHPTQVLLNHVANFKSLETLSHEMGHAIHAKRSAQNTPFYDGHSIVTAETASTLFENLVFDAVYKQANEKGQMVLMHDRITRDIATIERQVAFFNAELEIHNTIHQKGSMQNAELADCMYRHLKSYLGNGVSLSKKDGFSYAYIPHLRYGFYVYSYAYGILMSTIMAENYKNDNSYIEKIDQFLSAGSSAQVGDIFASIGIDTRSEDTFLKALDSQARDISAFEKLIKTNKK